MQVPPESIPLYATAKGWEDLPIYYAQSLEVNLPTGSEDGRYRNMTLELENTKNGQKQRYVISDRVAYTFNGLQRGDSFNVYLRNSMGAVLGEIKDVLIGEEDVSVTFESIRQSQHIDMAIRTPEGEDVTEQAQIRWFDSENNYLQQGGKLSGLLAGTAVRYSIRLPQTLGMQYALPADSLYTVQEEGNALVCVLQPFEKVTITGRVKDAATGSALSGAVVSVSQKLNGLYSKSFTAKTDNEGEFAAMVFNDQSSVTVSASDYLSQKLDFASFNDTTFVGEVALKSITGAVITTSLSYTESVAGGETAEVQDWYADHDNVAYEIYNETQGKAITQFNVQYPNIVLLEEVAEGDSLRLTASSRTNAFMPVTATATIDAQNRAEAVFNIIGLGGIKARFISTDNASVVGILYDSKGQMVKKYTYSNALLSIAGLADGDYTLVSMSNSTLFNSILNLSQFAASGLKEGADYVKNTVTVESGKMASVTNNLIPVLDESKLYYTGDNTSFSVNKTSLVAGNFLTLKGKIDFKNVYASKVSNISMVVDLPESCSFVENSVMVGGSIVGYTLDGSRLTIPLSGQSADQIRFCVIPTKTGDYTPCAFAQFALDGKEVLQPIGNANFTVKGLTISVSGTVSRTSIPVSGTVPQGNSTIEIFDNGIKIGETNSLANGQWSTTCELHEAYNLSTHGIYAKVMSAQGLELQSETQECFYDVNAIEVKTVTMINISHRVGQYYEEKTVFDFQNPPKSIPAYWYWPSYPEFTFLIDFTDNDTTKVSNVVLWVETCQGNQVPLQANYNADKGLWVASGNFGNWSNYDIPVNVSLDFDAQKRSLIDANLFKDLTSELEQMHVLANENIQQVDSAFSSDNDVLASDSVYVMADETDEDYTDSLSIDELEKLASEFLDNDSLPVDTNVINNMVRMACNAWGIAQEGSYLMSDGTQISIKSCEGLSEDNLDSLEYTKYETTDSSGIYKSNNFTCLTTVNFPSNTCTEIVYPQREIPQDSYDFDYWMMQLRNLYQPIKSGRDTLQNKVNAVMSKFKKELTEA
ncbi:MAG: carboxypeptidase regulatory-like domain-containing protein, partial [Bacteroidaceae bacterium]|nr:carboxypeptidase regulatory-like domain-containing protein [Bacteroidaceae bacterium]